MPPLPTALHEILGAANVAIACQCMVFVLFLTSIAVQMRETAERGPLTRIGVAFIMLAFILLFYGA